MKRRKNHQSRLILPGLLVLAFLGGTVRADVMFYLERHGSPEDAGQALFAQAVGAFAEQDFEDAALGPFGVQLPTLPVSEFQIDMISDAGIDPNAPWRFFSNEFNVEGEVEGVALVAAGFLTMLPSEDQTVLGIGTWIYDDFRALDSVYLIQVTEVNGRTWQAVLENEIPLDSYGHEIEGFVGAVSDHGIASMTIIALDPRTGEAHADLFEIDHLQVAGDPLAPPPSRGNGFHKKLKRRPHPRFDPHPGEWAPWHEGPNEYSPGPAMRSRRHRNKGGSD